MSRLLISLKKSIKTKKSNKKTMIGWKTFNPKKINKILPKIKKVIEIINTLIKKVVVQKQKQIIKLIVALIQKETIKTNNKNKVNGIRTNLYSSFFNQKNKMILNTRDTNIKLECNSIEISSLYNKYLLITKIINILNKVNVNDVKLPPKRTTYTVLRSPHADKKAREQFAKETYNTKIIVSQYVSFMKYFNKIVYLYTKPFITSYKYNKIY